MKNNPKKITVRFSPYFRSLRLSVRSDGRVVVSAPKKMSRRFIEKFVSDHKEWIADKLAYFEKVFGRRRSVSETRKDYSEKKEKARKLINSRLEHFNRLYGFAYKAISIRNQRTRWGSCSRRGNLSFNYRLIDLAPELADYIVVHELCHLGAFDHSKKFWTLVEKAIPGYKELRKRLKKEGMGENKPCISLV